MASVIFTSLDKLIHLLRSADLGEGAYVRVLGRGQLGLGTHLLHPTHTVDLAKEALIPCAKDEAPLDLEHSFIQMPEVSDQSPSESKEHRKEEKAPPVNGSQSSLSGKLGATKS